MSVLRNFILRVGFKYALAILGTGRPATNALRKMGAPNNKLVNFPYWVDLSTTEGQPQGRSGRTENKIRFVSSGRVINSLKGHDIAIKSLAKAFPSIQSGSFEYLIAGTGPDVRTIEMLARDLGIGENVKCLGWVEPSQLMGIFQQADVLIHPSPVHEPYGVAVIEAMAAGLVVLASDATGAALDRIEHGVNGLIHVAGSVNELTQQIEWVRDHPNETVAIKEQARRTAAAWPVSRGVETIERLVTD